MKFASLCIFHHLFMWEVEVPINIYNKVVHSLFMHFLSLYDLFMLFSFLYCDIKTVYSHAFFF